MQGGSEEVQKKLLKAKAITVLAKREFSRVELFRKLKDIFKSEVQTQLINEVLDELEGLNYLSDERYAQSQTHQKISRYGDQKIKYELRRKGIDSEKAQAAIDQENVPEEVRAKALWERKFGSLPKDQKERAKQFRYFASRGFSAKTISKLLRSSIDYDDF